MIRRKNSTRSRENRAINVQDSSIVISNDSPCELEIVTRGFTECELWWHSCVTRAQVSASSRIILRSLHQPVTLSFNGLPMNRIKIQSRSPESLKTKSMPNTYNFLPSIVHYPTFNYNLLPISNFAYRSIQITEIVYIFLPPLAPTFIQYALHESRQESIRARPNDSCR